MTDLSTSWTIRAVPYWPSRLGVRLTVDTQASSVVNAIEAAAAAHGIVLQRVPVVGVVVIDDEGVRPGVLTSDAYGDIVVPDA